MFLKKNLPIDRPVYKGKINGRESIIKARKLDKDTLIMDICKNGDKEFSLIPVYRLFQRKEEHIVYNYDNNKWSDSSLEYMYHYYYADYVTDRKSKKIIEEMVKSWNLDYIYGDNAINQILQIQAKYRLKKKEQRYKKEADLIDKEMEKFKDTVTDGMKKFLNKKVFENNSFLFYNRKKQIGYCTNCELEYDIKTMKFKHNEVVKCPVCKKKVQAKSEGISHKYLTVRGAGVIVSRHEKDLLFRHFHVVKDYRDYKNPKLWYKEIARTVMGKNETIRYEYKLFHNLVERWCKCYTHYNYWGMTSYYSENIRKMMYREETSEYYNLLRTIPNTHFKYSGVECVSDEIDAFEYLEAYRKHNYFEKLAKVGFIDIIKGFNMYWFSRDGINENEKKLHKILNITKDKYNILASEKNPSYNLYRAIKDNKTSKVFTLEQYKYIAEASKHADIQKLYKLLETVSINKVMKNIKPDKDISLYLDYIDTCNVLNWDLNILFPKDIKAAHDEAMSIMKTNRKNAEIEAINRILPTLNKLYCFKYKNLEIVIPNNANEYITESQIQHNCISRNYMGAMARNSSHIIFIRKSDEIDKPYYDLEISGNQVIQCRGIYNCDENDEIKEFLKKFKEVKKIA